MKLHPRTLEQIIWEQEEDGSHIVWLTASTDGYVEITIHDYNEKNEKHDQCSIVLKDEEEVEKFVKNLRTLFYKAQHEQTKNGY